MSRASLFFLIILFGGLLEVKASDSPRPREPVLANMPDRAAWVLEFGSKPADPVPGEKPPDDPFGGAFSITKNGKIYRVISEKSIGGYKEAWVIGSLVFLVNADASRCALVDTSAFPASDFSNGDFEHFQWINASNFIGVGELDGREVFVFETDALKRSLSSRDRAAVQGAIQGLMGAKSTNESAGTDAAPDANVAISNEDVLRELGWGQTIRAYVDMQTQRPLLLESDKLRISVKHLPIPTALTPPAVITRRLEAIQEESKLLNRR